jgi:UDP-N-acetylmuramyl pentapeptide synthase
MRARRLSEIATVTGGRIVGDDVEVRSVVVDSRQEMPTSSLFVAIEGERADAAVADGDARSRPVDVLDVALGDVREPPAVCRVLDLIGLPARGVNEVTTDECLGPNDRRR